MAKGGTLAEEVIGTVRTAQAFGKQETLSKAYDQHLEVAYTNDLKTAVMRGGVTGIFFFIIYSGESQCIEAPDSIIHELNASGPFEGYALAFYFGTTLILDGHGQSLWLRTLTSSL